MLSFYIQGLTLGLAYVAPIGMQNLFVINSAMREKLWRVAATAFIVIFWDISLALACFFRNWQIDGSISFDVEGNYCSR